MAVLLLVILAAIPLLITPNLLLLFDVTPKAALLLVGASVAIVLAAWKGIDLHRLLSHRLGVWFCGLLVAACVSALISTALSVDRSLSFYGTNWRRFGLPVQLALSCFVFVAAAWLAERGDRTRLVVRTFAACGLCAGAYGILQYFGWDPWLPRAAYTAGEGEWAIIRPPSTFGHANYFAAWMLFPVFSGAALAMSGDNRFWRVLGAAVFVLGSVAIVLSGSRSAVFGLAVAGAILAIWCKLKLSRKAALVLFCVAAGSAAFYVSPPGEMLRRRIHWIKEDPLGGARRWLWRDSLTMIVQRLPVGYGPETYSLAFPPFQSAELSRAYPAFYHESPHNIFLDAMAQQGIPGLAVLLGLAGLGLTAGFQAGQRSAAGKALCASLAGFLVAQQFNAMVIPSVLYFEMMVAILVVSSLPPPASSAHPVRTRSWIRLALILLALLPAWCGLRMWMADSMLRQAGNFLERGDLSSASEEYRKAGSWGERASLWYSRSMAAAAQKSNNPQERLTAWNRALEAAVRATTTAEDRQNAWYNLAAFRAGQNDFPGTEYSLRQAIQCAPNWFKAHWMLARFLQATGRIREARQEAELAAFLNAGKDPEVNSTVDRMRGSQQE